MLVVCPMSMLDCEQPACKERAAVAERFARRELGWIEGQIEHARLHVLSAMDEAALWELALEAKRRQADTGGVLL